MRQPRHPATQIAIRIPRQLLSRLDGSVDSHNALTECGAPRRPLLTRSSLIRQILERAVGLQPTTATKTNHRKPRAA